MSITAILVDPQVDAETAVGSFEFTCLPRVGERVRLPQSYGSTVYKISAIYHLPVDVLRDQLPSDRHPSVTLHGLSEDIE